MSIVAMAIAGIRVPEEAISRAKEVLARLLFPFLTPSLVSRYVRKALRVGAWHRLLPEQRALLLALSRARSIARIRSEALRSILARILLEIELATVRGRALLLGTIHALREGLPKLLAPARRILEKLLIVGLQILNHPLINHVAP